MESSNQPVVIVISDSIGETAGLVAKAAAIQFNEGKVEIRRIPYVISEEDVLEAMEEAKNSHCVIVYTLVQPELREILEKEAGKARIPVVDLMGPMLKALSDLTGLLPKQEPGLLYKLDKEYFRRIEAVEFAIKYDDGKDPRGLPKADLVLMGVSRTSKTPLSMYLANRKLKVANYPVVPEVTPPQELFQLPKSNVIGLTISPEQLNEIRQGRLKAMGLQGDSSYASMERILEELEYAESIMQKIKCPVVDVTNKAIEETASEILQIIKGRLKP